MTLAYAKKLGLWIQKTDIKAQKSNGSSLDTFQMVITGLQVIYKLNKIPFFQKKNLLANTNMKIILGMLFLTFNNADVQFIVKEFT